MAEPYNILILGASYGALLAIKAAMAGHSVTLVGRAEEVAAINRDGLHVRIPSRRSDAGFDLRSGDLPGTIQASGTGDVEGTGFDLVALAMQEPQFAEDGVRRLTQKVAAAGTPCLSIMNMPPPPYLDRIAGLSGVDVDTCYSAPDVWRGFDPAKFTLCSPDAQASRPPDAPQNFLRVGLGTNFRTAAFEDADADTMLRTLARSINEARVPRDGRQSTVPVRLKVSDSAFVPLTKWSMLLAGNYRCITADGPRSICDAVHSDVDETRAVYDWVNGLILRLGAADGDLVPFEQYAKAAKGLILPSSAARALYAGVENIERVDRLVQLIARQQGIGTDLIDDVVSRVDALLRKNRGVAA